MPFCEKRQSSYKVPWHITPRTRSYYRTLAAIEKVVCNHLDNTSTINKKGVNCNFGAASAMSGCQGGVCTKMQEK